MSVTHLPTRFDQKEIEQLYEGLVQNFYAFDQFKDLLINHPEGHHFDSVYRILLDHQYRLMRELQDSLQIDKSNF